MWYNSYVIYISIFVCHYLFLTWEIKFNKKLYINKSIIKFIEVVFIYLALFARIIDHVIILLKLTI